MSPFPARPADDAGRRNMLLLTQLRWLAVGGQLVTVAVARLAIGVDLPMTQLLMAIATLGALNIGAHILIASGVALGNRALTLALLFDVLALTVQLQLTGGLANPFSWLFLLQVVLGAILLPPRRAWAIVVASLVGLAALTIDPVPLALPPELIGQPFAVYIAGSLVCFVLIAVLLVVFVTRITRNLSERDAALAAVRQRAAEEDHIVRMGLLASGAAHELGTPLSTLSVILGDWRRMDLTRPPESLAEDVEEMEHAVSRCKAIVGGILMSAGEARGEAPEVTTMRAFLSAIVEDWRAQRLPGTLDYADQFGEDLPIVSDPALKQVIGNIIDNAAEVSPGWVGVAARREGEALVLEIADRGPGFAPEILASFGQPYRSTKGRPGGGLGLFLLVNVVRKLGGAAEAANRPEGGALVRVRLPLEALAYGERVRA